MNILLSQQTLRSAIAEQAASIERAKLATAEMWDRFDKNNVNMGAATKVITELSEAEREKKGPLEKQRLRLQISAQRHTIERQLLENMEGEARIISYSEQLKAAIAAKRQYEFDLQRSIEAHGEIEWPTKNPQ